MKKIEIYDTTLRDGTQGEGVSYTVEQKQLVARKLADLGIPLIEGGWPGSNPRDAEFFEAMRGQSLASSKLVAFGSTVRPGKLLPRDAQVQALLEAETPVVTIVAKTWTRHVRDDLQISGEANLELIHSTIAYLARKVERVIMDAEHFFDGYLEDPAYALSCLAVAKDAGVSLVCLCDTRGGSMLRTIAEAMVAAGGVGVPLGIHCHNDGGLAVANSLVAVDKGALQVQGTINGYGERCGNANLCTVIPDLQLKLGYSCLKPEQLAQLASVSHYCAELANLEPDKRQPYVGLSAFAHKGGLHVAAVRKGADMYEHVSPDLVGNVQRVLVSDLSGRSNLVHKAAQFGLDVSGRADELGEILSSLKSMESGGYQFEGAEASFELLMRKQLGQGQEFFKLLGFRVFDEKSGEKQHTLSEATVKIELPDGQIEHTAGVGNGPVNALDLALRKALSRYYPSIKNVQLHDYKVRVLDVQKDGGTAKVVRVLIESGNGQERWGTIGVSHNVVEASWQALVDSFNYYLLKQEVGR